MQQSSQHNVSSKNTDRSTSTWPSRQSNILSALPPELLACILSYLSAEPPSDIAACRLVNRTFKEHSSPLLLPRVVFARRLKEITKFREVLQHPYFRLHVQELVYDGSTYAEATAMDLDQYIEDCIRAPRELEDASWAERQRRDRTGWRKLSSFRTRNLSKANPSDHNMVSIDAGKAVNGQDEAAVPTIKSNDAYRLGCNKTFVDYCQRCADQQWIRREESRQKHSRRGFHQIHLPRDKPSLCRPARHAAIPVRLEGGCGCSIRQTASDKMPRCQTSWRGYADQPAMRT